MILDLDNLPKGIWLRREGDTIILGCQRQAISLMNLVPIFIGLAMLSPLILALLKWDWLLLVISSITTFIGISILIAEFGDIEFRLEEKRGVFFQGIGKIGYSYSLVYQNISSFDWVKKNYGSDIRVFTKKETNYNVNISDKNLDFIVKILNVFIRNPAMIKNQLLADLSHHLVK